MTSTISANDHTQYADAADRLERRLLTAFWQGVRSDADRLALLLEFTRLVVRREDTWNAEGIRRQHAGNYGVATTVRLDKQRCFSCGSGGQLYAHHIIEIQHGGSNAARNQVPLCFDCHQYLHPWLTEDDRVAGKAASGFTAIGDIVVQGIGS